MTEPDGVKDTIPKEMLDGDTKANPPKPVDEMTAGTILACRQKAKIKTKRRQNYHGNKARCQVYAKQYYQNQGETKRMTSKKEEQAQRDPTLLN